MAVATSADVEHMRAILRILDVMMSRIISLVGASTLAIMSYAPKTPCISFTLPTVLSSEITFSSAPISQFIKTYAVDKKSTPEHVLFAVAL